MSCADDHDVVNNLDVKKFKNQTLFPLLIAGLRAYYEYQHALRDQIPHVSYFDNCAASGSFDSAHCSELSEMVKQHQIEYFHVKNGVALAALDTRFRRSYAYDDEKPFLGTQAETLKTKIEEWFISFVCSLIRQER
jgi:hypothetical protein